MDTPVKGSNYESAEGLGFSDRFFLRVERLAYNRPIAVILFSLLTAFSSVWLAAEKLSFKNNRGDLVAKNLGYVDAYEKYRQEFEDFDGMMVVVADEDPGEMRKFVDFFATKLKSHPQAFSTVLHKIDTEYFRKKALLYLDQDELTDLGIKIKSHENFLRKINKSPGLNELLESINAEISEGMVNSILTGFLGYSQIRGKNVSTLIKERLHISVIFGLTGFLLSYLVCIPLGIAKAVRHGSKFDILSSATVFIGYSIPGYALGVLLLSYWGGDIFPLHGWRSPNFDELSFVNKLSFFFVINSE